MCGCDHRAQLQKKQRQAQQHGGPAASRPCDAALHHGRIPLSQGPYPPSGHRPSSRNSPLRCRQLDPERVPCLPSPPQLRERRPPHVRYASAEARSEHINGGHHGESGSTPHQPLNSLTEAQAGGTPLSAPTARRHYKSPVRPQPLKAHPGCAKSPHSPHPMTRSPNAKYPRKMSLPRSERSAWGPRWGGWDSTYPGDASHLQLYQQSGHLILFLSGCVPLDLPQSEAVQRSLHRLPLTRTQPVVRGLTLHGWTAHETAAKPRRRVRFGRCCEGTVHGRRFPPGTRSLRSGSPGTPPHSISDRAVQPGLRRSPVGWGSRRNRGWAAVRRVHPVAALP